MNGVLMILIAAELLFWIVIILGLISRYVLRMKQVGLILLAMTPVIDLILIITMSVDLLNGAKATVPHSSSIYWRFNCIWKTNDSMGRRTF